MLTPVNPALSSIEDDFAMKILPPVSRRHNVLQVAVPVVEATVLLPALADVQALLYNPMKARLFRKAALPFASGALAHFLCSVGVTVQDLRNTVNVPLRNGE